MSEFVTDLHERVVATALKLGISQATASMIAAEVVTGVCDEWAGCEPYIGRWRTHAERNRAINREHKAGEAVPFLARRYRLSRVRIWQIIKG